jgi:hypothetical protein
LYVGRDTERVTLKLAVATQELHTAVVRGQPRQNTGRGELEATQIAQARADAEGMRIDAEARAKAEAIRITTVAQAHRTDKGAHDATFPTLQDRRSIGPVALRFQKPDSRGVVCFVRAVTGLALPSAETTD